MAFQNLGLLMVKLVRWRSANRRRVEGLADVTVVLEDYWASGVGELSVRQGQQVEVVEAAPPVGPTQAALDWCLVRTLPPDGADPAQGLVPVSALKPIPMLGRPGARNSVDLDEATGDVPGTLNTSSSPVTKRRSFRKWLTTPVRKLSHGKIEKQGVPLLEASRVSKGEKRPMVNLLADKEPPEAGQAAEAVAAAAAAGKLGLGVTSEEPEPAQDIEMPPPMAIQGHSFKASPETPAAPADDAVSKLATLSLKAPADVATSSLNLASELENIVKQRIEPGSEATVKFDNSAGDEGDDGGVAGGGVGFVEGGALGESILKEEEELETVEDKEAEKAKYLKKRQFVIQELYDTEQAYVEDLSTIVEGYMGHMRDNPMPDGLEGKDKIVFGNIHQIYDWHRETMMKELEACLAVPTKVGSIFVRYERRLYMYVKYCENKPKSEYIVSEFLDTYFEEIRQKLGHRLLLPDLLIKPVQRIMRYQLLLKDILKYTEKSGEDTREMKRALHVMCVVPKAANDMMQVGRLQGFNGKITAQGKLLLQDTLLVYEVNQGIPQKPKERRLFLFEQIIILSDMIERKKGDFSNASYIYKNSLKVNKMAMDPTVEGEPLKFVLIDRTPGSDVRYITQATSEEVKETWIREIRTILDMQGDFLRALQSPIAYQKELTKELSAPEFGSLPRDSALRKTQSHPASGAKATSPLAVDSHSKKGRKELTKHERCRSVPMPLQEMVGENNSGGDPNSQKPPCPDSPTDTWKDISCQLKSGAGVDASPAESPKPKKSNFRGLRSLQRKSKNDGGSGGSSSSSVIGGQAGETSPSLSAYATTNTLPEGGGGLQDGGGSRTASAGGGGGEGGAAMLRPPLSQAADSEQVPVSPSRLTS